MIKIFFLLLILPILLVARQNPFFPVSSEDEIPLTSNHVEKLPPLKRAALTLPSTARTIKQVTVEYKNLDGSLATKTIELQNSIDWHLPIFISQNIASSTQAQESKYPIKSKESFTKVASLKFITFYVKEKDLKIITKDELLRNFLLVKPHRIVCDFRGDTDLGSFVKRVKKSSAFTKIKVGTHDSYYRVVLELDGYYSYKVTKTADGYLFKLL